MRILRGIEGRTNEEFLSTVISGFVMAFALPIIFKDEEYTFSDSVLLICVGIILIYFSSYWIAKLYNNIISVKYFVIIKWKNSKPSVDELKAIRKIDKNCMQTPVLEFKEIVKSGSDYCLGLYTEEQAKNIVKVGSSMGLNTELRTIRKIRGLKI